MQELSLHKLRHFKGLEGLMLILQNLTLGLSLQSELQLEYNEVISFDPWVRDSDPSFKKVYFVTKSMQQEA